MKLKPDDAFVWEIRETILNPELAQKIQIPVEKLPVINPSSYYGLCVDFDQSAYQNTDAIRSFPVKDSIRSLKSDKDMIYAMLSQQLDAIYTVFINLGYELKNSSICGELLDDPGVVRVSLWEDELKELDKKGRPKKQIGVRSVMPTGPQWRIHAIKVLAEQAERKQRELAQKEAEKSTHTPHMVNASALFHIIAEGILHDKKVSKKNLPAQLDALAAQMQSNYALVSDWPLEIEGAIGQNEHAGLYPSDHEIDLPETMLFVLDTKGNWRIDKTASLARAKDLIAKDIYRKKHVQSVVLLHQMKPKPFSLIMEAEDGGFQPIKKADAHKYKKLQVLWE